MPPTFLSRSTQTKTTAYTVTLADSGTVVNVNTAAAVTLPAAGAATAGLFVTIRNNGPNNGDSLPTITPAAADAVNGLGVVAAVSKGLQQTALGGARVGDEVTLYCTGVTGSGAWTVTNAVGVWTRQP